MSPPLMLTGSQDRRTSAVVPAAAAGEQWRAHSTPLVMDRQYRLAVRAQIVETSLQQKPHF
ncbi:hypothetical protein BDFB_011752 [Asbolus verrucosus]|uniref:Uncharacterized protein n=1 Tax=Asbolus verrucosus TaxID=1661398 RepID=A0A482VG45_ASBVE|nr:hypothetical protein BDFB_011752 [Asbolus verrucosus]